MRQPCPPDASPVRQEVFPVDLSAPAERFPSSPNATRSPASPPNYFPADRHFSCSASFASPLQPKFGGLFSHPYNTGRPNDRTKENPPPDARRVRRHETRRRLLPLRTCHGMHEQRRPRSRRHPFSSTPRTQCRLRSRLFDVCATAYPRIPHRRSQANPFERHRRRRKKRRPARPLRTGSPPHRTRLISWPGGIGQHLKRLTFVEQWAKVFAGLV